MEETPIRKFYKNTNVFITGGTGFMGKILIEKLLRSTEVDTIYLLVREKKGMHMHVRLEDLFDDVIFSRLKEEFPKYRHRVEAISGDCTMSGLGISIADRQTLMSKINVVFHVAATIRFDENLKVAYDINVNATKDVLNLARQMTNLKSIVHVSTAYSNCPYQEIEEKIYDFPVSHDDIKAVIEKVSEQEIELLTPRIIGKWPNTYTFTKALAESVIKEVGQGLPLAIFRPSVVISTYKEPIEGWIDNFYGPTGVTAAAISGVLRVYFCDQEQIADVIPVDTCVAGLIATAWDVSSKTRETSTEISVYNYVSSTENPVKWKEMVELSYINGRMYPSLNSMWVASVMFTKNIYMYWFLVLLFQIIPGLLIDICLVLRGSKPRLLKLYKKIYNFTITYTYFSVRSWKYSSKNMKNLWEKLDHKDKEVFPFSITTVHWLKFFNSYLKGIRTYLLKESDDSLEDARRKDKRFAVLNVLLKYILIYLLCHCIFKIISSIIYSILF